MTVRLMTRIFMAYKHFNKKFSRVRYFIILHCIHENRFGNMRKIDTRFKNWVFSGLQIKKLKNI